jgi:3-methyladenine DNA glycosylase/8-oxoguanine DNA glycosylase
LSAEVESLTFTIVEKTAGPEKINVARRIAEAQIDLKRVRESRYRLIANYPSMRPRSARVRIKDLRGMTPDDLAAVASGTFDTRLPKPPDRTKEILDTLADLTNQLSAMDRYERRALSRRKFAIRELDALRRVTCNRRS